MPGCGWFQNHRTHHDCLDLQYLFMQTVFSQLTLSVILGFSAVIQLKTVQLILGILELNQ